LVVLTVSEKLAGPIGLEERRRRGRMRERLLKRKKGRGVVGEKGSGTGRVQKCY